MRLLPALVGLLLCGALSGSAAAQGETEEPDDAKPKLSLAEEQRARFALAVENAVDRGDIKAFSSLFDRASFLEAVMLGLPHEPDIRDASREMVQSIVNPGFFIADIRRRSTPYSTYRFLGWRESSEQPRALFRQLDLDNRVNYHEFLVRPGKSPCGLVAYDVVIHRVGVSLSQLIREQLLGSLADQGVLRRAALSATERALLENTATIGKIQELAASGDFEKSWTLFEELPAKLREKSLAIARMGLELASRSADPKRSQAMRDFYEAHFPRDISLILSELYKAREAGDWGPMLESCLRLEKATGDPFIYVLRAEAAFQQQKIDEARDLIAEGRKHEEDLLNFFVIRLEVELKSESWDAAVWTLEVLERRFNYSLSALETAPEAAALRATESWQSWQKRRQEALAKARAEAEKKASEKDPKAESGAGAGSGEPGSKPEKSRD